MRTEGHLCLGHEPDECEVQVLLDKDFMTQLLDNMESLVCMLFACVSFTHVQWVDPSRKAGACIRMLE